MANDVDGTPLENEVSKRNVFNCKACHAQTTQNLLDSRRKCLTSFLITCCRGPSSRAFVLETPALRLEDLVGGRRRLRTLTWTVYELRLFCDTLFVSPCAFVIFKGCFRGSEIIARKTMKIPEHRLVVVRQKLAKEITRKITLTLRLSLSPIAMTATSMNQSHAVVECKSSAMCFPILMIHRRNLICVYFSGTTRRLGSTHAFHHRRLLLRKVGKNSVDALTTDFPRLLLKSSSSEISSDRYLVGFISRTVDHSWKISRCLKFRRHCLALERSHLRKVSKSSTEETALDSLSQDDQTSVLLGLRVWKHPRPHPSLYYTRYLRRLCKRRVKREVISTASESQCGVSSVPLERRHDRKEMKSTKCDVTCRVRVCSHSTRLDREEMPPPRKKQDKMPVTERDSGTSACESSSRAASESANERGRVGGKNWFASRPVKKHVGKTPFGLRLYRRPRTVSAVSVVSGAWAWVLVMLTLWACIGTAQEDFPMRNGCEAYADTEGEGKLRYRSV